MAWGAFYADTTHSCVADRWQRNCSNCASYTHLKSVAGVNETMGKLTVAGLRLQPRETVYAQRFVDGVCPIVNIYQLTYILFLELTL